MTGTATPGTPPIGAPPSNTVRLARRVRGSGPPLLLIAGTGYNGDTWPQELLEPLARRFTVVTFDHRGTGETPGTPGPYSTRLFAADALGLLDELGLGPAVALGHSMGGRVAQWMALDAPDRVARLVLAATGPGQFRDDAPPTRGIPLSTGLGIAEKGYEGYMRAHIERTFFTPEFAQANPAVVKWLADAFWDRRPGLEDYFKHVIARQEHQTAHLLERILPPALVLVGERDTHQGGTGSHWEQSKYLAANLPDATFRSIAGCAHGYFWQDPEATMAALDGWL
jgi:pimeloyl-ACP methyl ester carboxylesterase